MPNRVKTKKPCDCLEQVRKIAEQAGRRILDVYERDFTVDEKQDGSPLTEADRVSHETIVSELTKLDKNTPILSEEAKAIDYEKRRHWHRFWLVDPLDGTKEFINRNNEFTVNIALIDDGRPVLGVVYVPALALAYYACDGGGAFKQKGGQRPMAIQARRYKSGKPIIVASRSHAGEHLQQYLNTIGEYDLISMGSSLKFCLVAEGTADVYPRLGPTSEWDTAAAQCVVEVAGGHVLEGDGLRLGYNKPSILNPWFIVSGAGDYDWRRFLPPTK